MKNLFKPKKTDWFWRFLVDPAPSDVLCNPVHLRRGDTLRLLVHNGDGIEIDRIEIVADRPMAIDQALFSSSLYVSQSREIDIRQHLAFHMHYNLLARPVLTQEKSVRYMWSVLDRDERARA